MMWRISCSSIAAALSLIPARAQAGDPSAHTDAAVKAAQRVHGEAEFAKGVGAPQLDHQPQPGIFQIPIGTAAETPCPYESPTNAVCTISEINGQSINAPDSWSCLSPSQPPAISQLNSAMAWDEAVVSSVLSLFFDGPQMACNYTHFKSNSKLGASVSAPNIASLAKTYAAQIPLDIVSPGLVPRYCNQDTWNTYYGEVVNSLHYLQDMQTEHHATGNEACGPNDVLPTHSFNQSFRFASYQQCDDFLSGTLANATIPNPSVVCDEDIVNAPQSPDTRFDYSPAMTQLVSLCSQRYPLACMGIERVLRHHCRLPGVAKSLACSGPPGDHSGAAVNGNRLYCEGEVSTGGGQDFLTPATDVSVPEIVAAARSWAAVCKQPDDPCKADQCNTWCSRQDPSDQMSPGTDVVGSASNTLAGYCINRTPDSTCTLHTCLCAPASECGAHGQQCCAGDICNGADDVCSGDTGTCEEIDSGRVCGPPPSPPAPPDSSGASNGDPHLRTFDGVRYDIQAVGELTLAFDPTDGTEIQVRTQQWLDRNVAINIAVAARVGSDIVAFYGANNVRVNHVVTAITGGRTALPGGGAIYRRGPIYTVVWPDNSQVRLDLGAAYIGITLSLPDSRRGHLVGLLGNFDGNPKGELVTRGGDALPTPLPFAVFYGSYAESWRITQATSLFDYAAGQTTETFTNRQFPHDLITPQSIAEPEHSVALAVCQAAHVVTDWLDDCIMDVAITGDPGFANQLASAAPGAPATPPVAIAPPGNTGVIPGLFPTGVDDSGTALPSGAHDPHYQILNPAQDAIVINPGFSTWVPNTTAYHWVWQTAGMAPANVMRTFRLTFTLDGLDPTTASITGSWATDNLGSIMLNGQTLPGLTSNMFVALSSFTIPPGTTAFVPGINTLDFEVTDTGGVAGFLVASLSGSAEPLSP